MRAARGSLYPFWLYARSWIKITYGRIVITTRWRLPPSASTVLFKFPIDLSLARRWRQLEKKCSILCSRYFFLARAERRARREVKRLFSEYKFGFVSPALFFMCVCVPSSHSLTHLYSKLVRWKFSKHEAVWKVYKARFGHALMKMGSLIDISEWLPPRDLNKRK